MGKEVMDRRASDNEYLHKDFHLGLNGGIEYVRLNYGEQAVRDYLRQFATVFYAPLKEELKERGLAAIRDHVKKTYTLEGGKIDIDFAEDAMVVSVEACPAVMHIRSLGCEPDPLFHETTATVNKVICEGSDFEFELQEYEPETGRSVQRFSRRRS